ncbi:GNAT family N-acetyltransferase [Kitasatospora sp. LaBMicrA B282]|uniref:GNAT family N-acetyltransferase n=1 Tax=Kitasatospora sp. LaBMicrA B282 TaxID=3420949 RepID=UPI003D131613
MFSIPVDDDLTLVLAEPHLAEEVTALVARNRRHLARWEPWAEAAPAVDRMRAFLGSCLENFARGSQIQTYIRHRGRLAGGCGLRIDAETGTAALGYWLDEDSQGQGIVTRAARALLAMAITERRITKVEAVAVATNTRSRAVAERLGFSYLETLPQAAVFTDRREDKVRYVLDAEAFRAAGAPSVAVRRARSADIPDLVECSAALFLEDAGTHDPGVDTNWPRKHGAQRFAETLDDPTRLLLVAEAGDTVVGHLTAQTSDGTPMRPAKTATLLSLYVHPSHRGHRTGTELVEAFLTWARNSGAARASVTAYAANTGAIRCYERTGFTPRSLTLDQDL